LDTIYTEIHAYLENPTEQQREDLKAKAKKQGQEGFKTICINYKWLKDNGQEEALFYNPGKEIEKAYKTKEITREEMLNNPLKATYEKYVLPISYGLVEMEYPAAALAALDKTQPDYEQAIKKAEKIAEGFLKAIQEKTGCTLRQLAIISKDYIWRIYANCYNIYHKPEYQQMSLIIKEYTEKTAEIENRIKEPVTDRENDIFYSELNEIEKEFNRLSAIHYYKTHQIEEAREKTEEILQRIFPKETLIIEKIESPIKWENLMPMLQDPFTNELTWLKSDTGFIYDDISERYSKQIKSLGYEIDFKKFIIDEEGNKKPLKIEPGRFLCSIRAKKLLDALMIKLTKEQETIIKLSLNDYLDLFGISKSKPSKDKIRIILKEDLAAINSIGFNYDGAKRTADFKHIAIGANSYGIKNGVIYFEFREEFTNYIKTKNYITQYPIKLFKLDNRNSNAYYLGRKLSYHSSLYNNQKKGTADIIKVKTLLQVCDLISYNQLKKTSGAVTQKIIDPFEKALDSLREGVLDQWEYCNAKKQPLNDEQLKTLSYDAFTERYIKFTLKDKPKTKEADETKKRNTNKKPVKSKKSIPLK
jgi:hypothetical protein